jgi:transglutaminase-like putative cysteine protease
MSFGREKRLLIAWLLMMGPLPLPFTLSIEWPALFLYEAFLIYFIQRVEQERPPMLPNWVLNILGLAYMPILFIDMRASFAVSRPMAALLHLIMFLGVVKLYALRHEKEKWLMVAAAFFLFIGSMASSTHVTVVLYLMGFTVLWLFVLARFAYLHMLALHQRGGDRSAAAEKTPQSPRLRIPLTAGALLIVLVAIPTFATLPRFRDPFLMGPGGSGSLVRSSGFSDSVDLSLTSSIRGNRAVALRLKYLNGAEPPDESLRIKGATFDVYEDRRWHRHLKRRPLLSPISGVFELTSDEPQDIEVEIFRDVLNSRSLPLPVEATAFELRTSGHLTVGLDLGGAVLLPRRPTVPVSYTVRIADQPRSAARLVGVETTPVSFDTALDQSGVTDRLRQLARDVMGEGSDEERIVRLEAHLLSSYSYTTTFVGREGLQPLEDFLFTYKSGHCELFASAMVILLRAEGIPARFATGFLGGELNPLEGYYIVRQENAHAWVEAYTEGSGWQVYDPTPPEGRPAAPSTSLLRFASQLYDYVNFRWDRYILTYGADDQRDFFERVREFVAGLWKQLGELLESDEKVEEYIPGIDTTGQAPARQRDLWLATKIPTLVAVSLFVIVTTLLFVWHRRRLPDASSAYRQLRRLLDRSGLLVTESLAPLELERRTHERFPSAGVATQRLTALYLRENFAEIPLSAAERAELKPSLATIRRGVREDQKRGKKR